MEKEVMVLVKSTSDLHKDALDEAAAREEEMLSITTTVTESVTPSIVNAVMRSLEGRIMKIFEKVAESNIERFHELKEQVREFRHCPTPLQDALSKIEERIHGLEGSINVFEMEERVCVLEGRINMFEEWMACDEEEGG